MCNFVCYSSRTDLIQSALERLMSQLSNARFPDIFESFLTFPDRFEVAKSVKKRRNFDLNFSFIHVTLRQN